MHKEQNRFAVPIVMLGVLGASTSSLWVRFSDAPSLTLAFYRMAFAAILLCVPVLLKFRKELFSIGKKTLFSCILSGVFVSFHFWLYFLSVHKTTLSAATLLANLEVFFVGFFMFFAFGEKLSRNNIFGIVLTLLGSAVLCVGDGLFGGSLIGDLFAFGAGLAVAVYTVIGRRVREGEAKLSTTTYTFLVYLSAAVTLGILCIFTKTPIIGYANTGMNMLMGLGLTVFCTILGHSIFSWGLKYLKAALISTMKLAEPVFATVCGILLFAEMPQFMTVLGGFIIILGVWLTTAAVPARDASHQ